MKWSRWARAVAPLAAGVVTLALAGCASAATTTSAARSFATAGRATAKTPCRDANAFAWQAIIVTGPGPVSLR